MIPAVSWDNLAWDMTLHGTEVGWEANVSLIFGESCLVFTQDPRIFFSLIAFSDR